MESFSVLVCVTDQKRCERLIVAGAEIAKETGARLVVIHVARPDGRMLEYESAPGALEYLLQVSVSHGADMVVVRSNDIVGTLEANVSAASIFSNAPLRITVPSFCPRNP